MYFKLLPLILSPSKDGRASRHRCSWFDKLTMSGWLWMSSFLFLYAPAYAAVSDDLQFAAALFNEGEYRQALDEFTRLQPSLAGAEWEDDVMFWMAECHFYLHEYSKALEFYQRLISNYPGFPRLEEVYAKVMGANYAAGRFEEVVSHADIFSRKFPSSSSNEQVYLLWIQSALRLKTFTRAEELLDAYRKMSPGSPYVWSLKSILANFYLQAQRFDRALPYFEELHTYQKEPNFLLWIGECRFQQNQWAGAREAFSELLLEQPQNDVARLKLGLAEYRLGNFAAAVDALKPLGEKEGGYTEDALYFVAQSLLQLGHLEEAKKNLAGILNMSPNEELRTRAVAQLLRLESDGGKADIGKMIAAYEKYAKDGTTRAGAGQIPPIDIQQYKILAAYQKQDFRTVASLLIEPKDRRDILMLAESLYALGNYPDASRAYKQLLSVSSTPAEKRPAYAGLAWSAYAQEQYEEAVKAFGTYVSNDPGAPEEVHLAMAQCAMALGQTEMAISYYDKARKTTSEPRRILRNLGILYFNGEDYQRAAETLESVADDDQIISILVRSYVYLKQPNKAMTYSRRLKHPEKHALEIGAVHYELGQMEEAKTWFEKADQMAGVTSGLNIDEYLGIIAHNQGNYPEAATRLRKAQLKDPNNIEILYELAASLMRMENAPQQELIEILRRLVSHPSTPARYRDAARMWLIRKSAPSDVKQGLDEIDQIENTSDRASAFEHMATNLFSQQAYDTAALFYNKLLASQGLKPETRMQGLYGLGWSLHKIGQKEKAAATFRTLLEDYPKSSYAAEVVLNLVEDAYGAGQYADAANLALKHVNKTSKNAARLRFMAAESLYEIGRYADAVTYYNAFLPEADNLAGYTHYRAGLASYHLKNFDRAAKHFSAVTDSAYLESKYYYLGMSYYSMGKKKQAAEEFENVIQIGHGDFQEEAWKNLVVLIEELGLWRKAISFGTRMSESPHELPRLVYAKALYHLESSVAARYAEKLGYIAKDPDIASESLLLAALTYTNVNKDPDKSKQLFEKIIQKYPKSRAAAEARKALGKTP